MPESKESLQYPAFSELFSGWFHQDYDMYGPLLEDVLNQYRAEAPPEYRIQTASEIRSFMSRYGASDKLLADSLERVFNPDVRIEGWDGRTTRQWLEYVADYLERSN